MFITNIEDYPEEKFYRCDKEELAHWLIWDRRIPLLGRTEEFWIFSKTKLLERALEEFSK